ncbi:MAG: hypothetical protein ACRDV0_08390 [Acidimicrobiales bacterium]
MKSIQEMAAMEGDPGRRRAQLALAGVAVALVVADVVAAFIFPWWRARMVADFWPLDTSRIAPKIIATLVQAVIAIIFVAVFWPPLRRRISALLEESGHRANEDMHRRLAEVHERMNHLMSHHGDLHAKLDHIIRHHPDVPDFDPRGVHSRSAPGDQSDGSD